MKRLLFALGLVAGMACALAWVRSQLSVEAATEAFVRTLGPWAGSHLSYDGSAEVLLFPHPAIRFRHVRYDGGEGRVQAAEVDTVTAAIDVLPLLIGRLSIADVRLDHPRVTARTRLDLEGLTPDREALKSLNPANITIVDGEFAWNSTTGDRAERVEAVTGQLRWPRRQGSASLDLVGRWRGDALRIALQGIAPPRLAAGETGEFDLSVASTLGDLSFVGKTVLSDRLQIDGAFSARTAHAARLAAGLGIAIPDLLGLGQSTPDGTPPEPVPLLVEGRWRSSGWAMALSEARLRLGAAQAEGVVSVRIDALKPQVRGTLAFDHLDLSEQAAALAAGPWRSLRLDPELLSLVEMDLRLSIADLKVPALQLSRIAASLLVTDGQVHAEIGEATLFGGTGSLVARGQFEPGGLKTYGRFTLVGTQLQSELAALGLEEELPLRGSVSTLGEFETVAPTLGELVATLRLHLTAEALRLAWIAPEPMVALQRAMRGAGLPLEPGSVVDRITMEADVSGQDVAIRSLESLWGEVRLRLAGSFSSATRMLALTGTVGPAAPAKDPAATQPDRILRLQGSLSRPALSIEASP